MATREEIIHDMCLTFDHSYGLEITESESMYTLSGMTKQQREFLWNQMAQVFDNDLSPVMTFKQ